MRASSSNGFTRLLARDATLDANALRIDLSILKVKAAVSVKAMERDKTPTFI